MKYFMEFVNNYGVSIIHSIGVCIMSYVSLEFRKVYKKYIEDKTKKEVVKMVCDAVEQVYSNYTGSEKLNEAIINSRQILKEKGININDLELRMYIESNISQFKILSDSDMS